MGAWMLLDKVNYVDKRILCDGFWEADQIALLRNLIAIHARRDQRTVFLDVGAHGGLYCLTLHAAARFDRMIAFEPEATSLAQLRANLLMNNLLDRVEIVPNAASSFVGQSRFWVGSDANRGQSRLIVDPTEGGGGEVVVDVTTVDAVCDERNSFIVCKIDVEGSETVVIGGMTNILRQNKVILQIENNHRDPIPLVELLESLDLRLFHSRSPDFYFANFDIGEGVTPS